MMDPKRISHKIHEGNSEGRKTGEKHHIDRLTLERRVDELLVERRPTVAPLARVAEGGRRG